MMGLKHPMYYKTSHEPMKLLVKVILGVSIRVYENSPKLKIRESVLYSAETTKLNTYLRNIWEFGNRQSFIFSTNERNTDLRNICPKGPYGGF